MALSKQEILDAVAGMSVLELSELIKMMEEKFGVSAAAAAVSVAAAPAASSTATPGRTTPVLLAAATEQILQVVDDRLHPGAHLLLEVPWQETELLPQ
jgi:large subunit ribosomal protein L7/L12